MMDVGGCDCREVEPALAVFELLAPKWHPIIVMTLHHHRSLRFSELLSEIPNISSHMLSRGLDELSEAGVVANTIRGGPGEPGVYVLTDGGRDLVAVFQVAAAWAGEHLHTD